jgi:hypothetical protein
MIDGRVWLDDPTVTSTEKPATTGARRQYVHPTNGVQEYILVYNGTGSTIAANVVVTWSNLAGAGFQVTLPPSANEIKLNIAGVTQVAIPNLHYGWVLRNGMGQVAFASAAASAGLPARVITTAGTVDDTTESAEGTQFFCKLVSAHAGTGVKTVIVQLS